MQNVPGGLDAAGRPIRTGDRYPGGVSQVDRDRTAKVADELPPEERAWLEEQLTTYRELLAYLHDH